MKKNQVWVALAGLAAVGAGVGAALVYLKKQKKEEPATVEEELPDEDCGCCETERTYTILSDTQETSETEDVEKAVEEEVPETTEEPVPTEEA